ncbi:MAG: bifunctional nuclease family protein [Candidatus Sumerlaeota bacterium]|nr:bifunctional nuclease family protein [Candidatus Sumerlaeota bacterium]
MLIEMEIREIQMKEDPRGAQIVILGEKGGSREFPIFIGYFEAQALYFAAHGRQPQRPMTHDLLYNVIDGLDARLVGVCVDDLREETFHGKLMIEQPDGKQVLIDSRPSDAIVLAVKRQTPIYVEDSVLDSVINRGQGEQEPPEEGGGGGGTET